MPTTTVKPTRRVQAQAVRIITDAKELLLTDGWMTGDFLCEESGRRCAVGALRAAAFGTEYPTEPQICSPAYRTVIETIANTINKTKVKKAQAERHEDDENPAALVMNELEDVVIEFNDGRAETQAGRNTIIRRLDKAVTALS